MEIEKLPAEQDNIERITNVLEGAMARYKENPEKGEVDIVVKDTWKDWEYATRTKIAEIVDGNAVSSEGDKIPLWCIAEVELVDEA